MNLCVWMGGWTSWRCFLVAAENDLGWGGRELCVIHLPMNMHLALSSSYKFEMIFSS